MTNAEAEVARLLNTTSAATLAVSERQNTTSPLPTYTPTAYNSTDNATSTASSGLGGHGLPEVIVIAFVAVILMLVTVFGNMLVIIAYRRNRRLRSVNNLFLVSLACSDLVIGLVSMNLYPIYMITDTWHFGEVACDIWLCIDYTLSMASVANLMLICLDRYFSVTRPFTYRMKRTRPRAKIAIVSAWTFSMLLWSPAIVIWPRVRGRTVPGNACYIQFFENPVITLVTAILAFYLPVVVMAILYWRIFMETRRCHQYLEYLKSYKITRAGGRSPAIKRKASAPESESRSRRRRFNSTPATGGTRHASLAVPPSFTSGNLRSRGYSTSIPVCSDSRNDENRQLAGRERSYTHTGKCENNNSMPPRFSSFSRLKKALTGSLLKANVPEDDVSQDCPQGNTDSSYCRKSSGLAPSTHSSCTLSPTVPEESCALLPSNEKDGNLAKNDGVKILPTMPKLNLDNAGVIPAIVTPEDQLEQHTPLFVRRTRSEGDSFLSRPQSRNVQVPIPAQKPAAPSSHSVKMPSSERKAARTLSAILAAFVFTWLPYNVCVVYASFCGESCVPDAVWDFAYYLCYINSLVDPFCFALCNKTFRDTFRRILWRDSHFKRTQRKACCLRPIRKRDNISELHTVQQSTSSSRSVPPSPGYKKRESSST